MRSAVGWILFKTNWTGFATVGYQTLIWTFYLNFNFQFFRAQNTPIPYTNQTAIPSSSTIAPVNANQCQGILCCLLYRNCGRWQIFIKDTSNFDWITRNGVTPVKNQGKGNFHMAPFIRKINWNSFLLN